MDLVADQVEKVEVEEEEVLAYAKLHYRLEIAISSRRNGNIDFMAIV